MQSVEYMLCNESFITVAKTVGYYLLKNVQIFRRPEGTRDTEEMKTPFPPE